MLAHTRGRDRARFYRNEVKKQDLFSFSVCVKETDLFILAELDLSEQALQLVRQVREEISRYIVQDKRLLKELKPIQPQDPAPEIIKEMCEAATVAGVGPMAAVAGAIAQKVGRGLKQYSDNVIVENGGDLYIDVLKERNIGLYAGPDSPFSMQLGLQIDYRKCPIGVCTSSGKIGHSLSFGNCDASVVLAKDVAIADAMATAVGNRVKDTGDIPSALEWVKERGKVLGAIIMIGDKIGVWGDVEVVRL